MSQKQALQVAVQDFGGLKLPRLGRKKRIKHSKNPYKIKQILIPDDDAKPKKRLDGFLLLKITKNDLPHEIIRADISKMNIVETVVEDTKYFINLSHLDASENEINLEDLVYFQNLVDLKICQNKIEEIKFHEETNFLNLQNLDLSFNYLIPQSIEQISYIPNLKVLNLENNELREIPEDMSRFNNLEDLNLNSNLFQSDSKASTFWYTLACLRKLKILSISRNQMRGIHTEKLVAGNFQNLETLDFSYNIVENQHNLICARNFRKLKKLIVSGNPFGILQEHKGLEMEIYARTGAELINEDIERPYLKQDKNKNRPKIQYDHLRTVENDNFGKDRNYFMGIEMPKNLNIEENQEDYEQKEPEEVEDPQLESEIKEKIIDPYVQDDQDYEEEEEEEQENVVGFMTENPYQQAEKKRQNNQSSDFQKQQFSQQSGTQFLQENQLSNQMSHEEFMKACSQNLGDSKEYDQHYDYLTAHKTLNNVIKRGDDFEYKNNEQPHYMQSTKTQKRFKQNNDGSSIVQAGSFEQIDIRNNQSQSKKSVNEGDNQSNQEEMLLENNVDNSNSQNQEDY